MSLGGKIFGFRGLNLYHSVRCPHLTKSSICKGRRTLRQEFKVKYTDHTGCCFVVPEVRVQSFYVLRLRVHLLLQLHHREGENTQITSP